VWSPALGYSFISRFFKLWCSSVVALLLIISSLIIQCATFLQRVSNYSQHGRARLSQRVQRMNKEEYVRKTIYITNIDQTVRQLLPSNNWSFWVICVYEVINSWDVTVHYALLFFQVTEEMLAQLFERCGTVCLDLTHLYIIILCITLNRLVRLDFDLHFKMMWMMLTGSFYLAECWLILELFARLCILYLGKKVVVKS
jgi:uncharacterized membrane protein